MLPLRDSAPTHRFPLITVALIATNIGVFLVERSQANLDLFLEKYALIASQINFVDPRTLTPFITSQFLHGGWFHLIFNMWFLWIFSDNVEDRLGKIRFLIFYLSGGAVAAFVQYLFLLGSSIPMLGASGAVAAILGAYLVLFPDHKIDTLIPLGLFYTTARIPAQVVLIFWFVGQLFSGTAALATPSATEGIAWWAHIGGFVFGLLVAKAISSLSFGVLEKAA